MGLFNRTKSTSKKIQATEGTKADLEIVDGLTWARISSGIKGTSNDYLTFGHQVEETYRKYKGMAEWGATSVRVIVDTRTAFIAGEGAAIASKDDRFINWVSDFLKYTKLSGSLFFDAVMGSEMAGRSLFVLTPQIGTFPIVIRIPYSKDKQYKIINNGTEAVISIKDGEEKTIKADKFVFIRTGGDDASQEETTTRVGLVLTDCENYDRALKDIRRQNYTSSRITPTFKTESDEETTALTNKLKQAGWKIGQAFIGKAEFEYKNSGVEALENLKTELAAEAKTISAVTGVPVHWFGHTDLMSNRATADDLYQMISNATTRERTLMAEGLYELIVKAQRMYIDAGGSDITSINYNFTVNIAAVDFGRFESMIRALSTAYMDEAISIDDYRGFIPGIDPIKTKKAVEETKKQNKLQEPKIDELEDDVKETEREVVK